MPQFSNERWMIVSPALDSALDLPANERVAFLVGLRLHDPQLAADVEALLEHPGQHFEDVRLVIDEQQRGARQGSRSVRPRGGPTKNEVGAATTPL